jgi:outer membrane protein TolC
MRNRRRLEGRIGLWSLGALLAACTVGPDYHAPDAAVPAQFAGAAPARSGGDLGQWWQSFNDPVLDGLITQALRDNLDVQTAASRIREARLQEVVAGAGAWPSGVRAAPASAVAAR